MMTGLRYGMGGNYMVGVRDERLVRYGVVYFFSL
jgi:hypothetical protein